MTRSEQMQVVLVCAAPGWDVVRLPQPAADDRLGRAAIEAMGAIMGAMREEREDAEMLTMIEQAVQRYMGHRWAIQRETGK